MEFQIVSETYNHREFLQFPFTMFQPGVKSVKRSKNYADHKMAAAGDRDWDDEYCLPIVPGGLPDPVPGVKPYAAIPKIYQPVVEPVIESQPISGEVRVVEKKPYDVGIQKFGETLRRDLSGCMDVMSRFIQEDREIVAEFGYNTANTQICLGMGYANGHQLHGGKISLPLIVKSNLEENVIVLEKLHPMVYRMTMDRKELVNIEEEPFSGVLLEVGFYSRVIGSDKKDYLGKIKAFFPKPDDKMMFYLDLSKIK
uniref:Uncharacterized protein n=1 Tax=Burkholderia phage vB_BgluM-SURPRISE13 TaxID=3159457 RepID=A0AAU7PFA8_9VIRU